MVHILFMGLITLEGENMTWFHQKDTGELIPFSAEEEAEIRTRINAESIEQARTEYIRNRVAEYPSINDQLDLLYHGGMDAWKAAIKAVKDKYPKG